MRRVARALLLFALVSVSFVVPVTGASATLNYCGSGYAPIQTVTQPYGVLTLYYNSSNKNNCATLAATGASYGTAHFMQVSLFTSSTNIVCDPPPSANQYNVCGTYGNYRYYAGPIYLHAPGVCIRATGGYRWPSNTGPDVLFDTGYGHCT